MTITFLRCVIAFGLLSAATSVGAQAPVPAALRSLKTAVLENQVADLKALDELAKQLRSWNHFEIVDSEGRADVVIALAMTRLGTPGLLSVGGGVFVAAPPGAFVWSIRTVAGDKVLWIDSEKGGMFSEYGGIKNLVGRLRRRMEEKP